MSGIALCGSGLVSMVDDAFNFLAEYDLYHEDKKSVFKSVIFLIKALFSV